MVVVEPDPEPQNCKACRRRMYWWMGTMVALTLAAEHGLQLLLTGKPI